MFIHSAHLLGISQQEMPLCPAWEPFIILKHNYLSLVVEKRGGETHLELILKDLGSHYFIRSILYSKAIIIEYVSGPNFTNISPFALLHINLMMNLFVLLYQLSWHSEMK